MNDGKEQIFDIYDVWYESLLTQTWFIAILLLFFTIVIGIVLYFIYTGYFNKPVKVDPLVIIKKNLDDLRCVHIENEQDCKRVYFQLTELIKEYIFYRFKISVVGLTDREIIEWAQHDISEENRDILEKLLLDVASIKFEHQVTTTEQLQEYILLMQEFIKKTTPEHTHRKEA